MPTVAEALPNLRFLLDELTADPLSAEQADALIAVLRQVTETPHGAALDATIDPMFRLAEARETRAFKPLCQLLSAMGPGVDKLDFGNVVTEILPSILVALFDGTTVRLTDMILSGATDDYVRSSALFALVQLVRDGRIGRADAERVLSVLPGTSPENSSVLWHSWAMAIAALKLHEFAPVVERTLSGSDIEDADETLAHFCDTMAIVAASPNAASASTAFEFTPFTTAAAARARTKEMSEMFTVLADMIQQSRAARATDKAGQTVRRALDVKKYGYSPVETVTNDHRHVGRNDPCPCGSGKKHKKCCLN
jgi:hypothetical protein